MPPLLSCGNSNPFSLDHLPCHCDLSGIVILFECHLTVLPVDPGDMHHYVLLIPGIQPDVIHVKVMAKDDPTPESISVFTLCTEGDENNNGDSASPSSILQLMLAQAVDPDCLQMISSTVTMGSGYQCVINFI